ncbi:MAG: serine hydrolase [Caulobacter sp.]|nr:serine hydrolase [Caulobacter sp.]
MSAFVEAGDLAGVSTLVWKGGAVAHRACFGLRDIGAALPIEPDTLFRIASMSKPVTCLAALMLMEEGAFALDDPITGVAPEFADMRVMRSVSGAMDDTVPAARPITFNDLLSHRSGLTYGDFHPGPIAAAFSSALGGDIDSDRAPEAWVAALARLPLIDQPGAGFHYGHSTDLLGMLIARLDDAPLGQVLQRRIFGPLGMKDTGFIVPPKDRARRAAACGFDAEGRPVNLPAVPGGAALPERPDDMTFESGGQGLWSTMDDYLAFARLFIGGGAVDGVRLLRPGTLSLMTSNHLTPDQRASGAMFGMPMFAAGHGFGLGLAVMMEPDLAQASLCGGGAGSVGWPGAYGGWWTADAAAGSVSILLAHSMVDMTQMSRGIGLGVHMARARFAELARGLEARPACQEENHGLEATLVGSSPRRRCPAREAKPANFHIDRHLSRAASKVSDHRLIRSRHASRMSDVQNRLSLRRRRRLRPGPVPGSRA